MVLENRVTKMRITSSHPDYNIAQYQSSEARRLYNTLNYVVRKIYAQREYNYEYNRTVVDKRRKINAHTKLDFLYKDPTFRELKIVGWLKKNRHTTFQNKHDFVTLTKHIIKSLKLDLNSKIVQHVGIKLAEAWKSYNVLTKLFWKTPHNSQKPSPPGYKQKWSLVEYSKQTIRSGQKTRTKQTSIHHIIPTGWTVGVKLPNNLSLADISSARLVPLHDKAYTLEILYQTETPEPTTTQTTTSLSAAIDLGVDVLAAIVFSDGRTPLLVNGKPLKSINQHANKENAILKIIHNRERKNIWEKQKVRTKLLEKEKEKEVPSYPHPISSIRLDRLWSRRNDRIDQYCHTASRRVVDTLVSAGVTNVAIGWNKGFKDKINLGKINNQNFCMIPLARFRDQLVYKLREKGIRVQVVEESYTSQASFLDGDHIPTYGTKDIVGWKPSGRRIYRGLYKSKTGILIHADVNAAYNILAKHVVRIDPNLVVSDTGVVVHPVWLEMPTLEPKPRSNKSNQTKSENTISLY